LIFRPFGDSLLLLIGLYKMSLDVGQFVKTIFAIRQSNS